MRRVGTALLALIASGGSVAATPPAAPACVSTGYHPGLGPTVAVAAGERKQIFVAKNDDRGVLLTVCMLSGNGGAVTVSEFRADGTPIDSLFTLSDSCSSSYRVFDAGETVWVERAGPAARAVRTDAAEPSYVGYAVSDCPLAPAPMPTPPTTRRRRR